MTWTLFEFGKRRNQVIERTEEIAQAEENLTRLRNRIKIDVEKAVREVNPTAKLASAAARALVTSTGTRHRRVASDQAETGMANRSVFLNLTLRC